MAWLEDLRAVQRNDPAAHHVVETLLCHTPLHAIWTYRVAHYLHARLRLPVLPRFLSVLARWWTGVEIHSGAKIGRGFFIDHGQGTVIGETSVIGDRCTLFHNVTLGGTGKQRGKGHRTREDDVFAGAGAALLGPITVARGARVGANSFFIMRDVPAGCTAVGNPARIVREGGRRVEKELPPTVLTEHSIPVAQDERLGPVRARRR